VTTRYQTTDENPLLLMCPEGESIATILVCHNFYYSFYWSRNQTLRSGSETKFLPYKTRSLHSCFKLRDVGSSLKVSSGMHIIYHRLKGPSPANAGAVKQYDQKSTTVRKSPPFTYTLTQHISPHHTEVRSYPATRTKGDNETKAPYRRVRT